MPPIATDPERGPRWGLVGVMCAVLLGLLGLYGVEMHCSAQDTQQAVHALAAPAPHQHAMQADWQAQPSPVATTSITEQPESGRGDLLLCALVATCLALLITAASAGRSGAGRLVPARTCRARGSRPPTLSLPTSTFLVAPLRC